MKPTEQSTKYTKVSIIFFFILVSSLITIALITNIAKADSLEDIDFSSKTV